MGTALEQLAAMRRAEYVMASAFDGWAGQVGLLQPQPGSGSRVQASGFGAQPLFQPSLHHLERHRELLDTRRCVLF